MCEENDLSDLTNIKFNFELSDYDNCIDISSSGIIFEQQLRNLLARLKISDAVVLHDKLGLFIEKINH